MIIEQTDLINAPIELVMQMMSEVERIPTWATVEGEISQVQGSGRDMTYAWRFTVDGLDFEGRSRVIEQTDKTLITETSGDVASIWSINLTPVGQDQTMMQVVVEYTPPNTFMEVLTDVVLQRYATPNEAYENMRCFKAMVEEEVSITQLISLSSDGR